MKIQKIACPSCGFSFKIKKAIANNSYECPACKAALYIEDEKPTVINININNYAGAANEIPAPRATKLTIGQLLAIIFIVVALLAYGIINFQGENTVVYSYRTVPQSEPFIAFVERVYGKDLADITAEDYQKIKYLQVLRDCPALDWPNADKYPWRFDYAFSVAQTGEPIDMKSVFIDSTAYVEKRDLQVFTNVVNAGFGKYGKFEWEKDSYSQNNYKNLQKLTYYRGDSFASLIDAFYDPAAIEKLAIDYMRLGDGDIAVFSGLKSLSIDYVGETKELAELAKLKNLEALQLDAINDDQKINLNFLVSLTHLKSLRLKLYADAALSEIDFFYGMPNIEELELSHINQLRNLDFIKTMPKLNSLKLQHIPIIDIEPLRDNVTLTQLSLMNLYDLADVSALATIKNLKELTLSSLDVAEDMLPNLSGLALLKDAVFDAQYLGALDGVVGLENLNITTDYSMNDGVIAQFKNLKELKIKISSTSENTERLSAIAQLPALTHLTIYLSHVGTGRYYIGSLFASNQIETLSIYNPEFGDEIICFDLDNMADNRVLKALSLNDININNSNLSDDQYGKLGGYTDQFFKHFSALEELHVANNQIENLDFVAHLPNLKILDISDNYVTDIAPLLSCKKLVLLKCERNAITNLNLLPDRVQVITGE